MKKLWWYTQLYAPLAVSVGVAIYFIETIKTQKDEIAMLKQNLVVVSKIKEYVKAKADLNTSDAVAAKLTEQIEKLLDNAIEKAKKDKRKTVLDRDVAVFDVAH